MQNTYPKSQLSCSHGEKKEKSAQTFSDIMRGMQYSVNTAQQVLERHHLYLLNKYFDGNGFPQTKDFWA